MKPRSLLFDLFGDYLRYQDSGVPLRSLVCLMDAFGIPDSTTRVVANRMKKEGWLRTTRRGRESVYFLTPQAVTMLDEGRERIFASRTTEWDGQWHMAIYSTPESNRALRSELRRRLAWLGFGTISAAVWLSPHDRLDQLSSEFCNEDDLSLDLFHVRSRGRESDIELSHRAWDLTELASDYRQFIDTHTSSDCLNSQARDRNGSALSDDLAPSSLIRRTQLVHDYRTFPFRDPNLPASLLPANWPGFEAHDLFLEAHESLADAATNVVHGLLESIA